MSARLSVNELLHSRQLNALRKQLVVNRRDGSVLVRVPAGSFEMGDGKESNCPKHRVDLSGYWIGVYAVTNRQYARFVKETRHRAPDAADYGDPVWKNGQCPVEKLDHPVVYVSWDDARAYCQWSGGDLPTEAQWETACRGPAWLIYPWGNEWGESKCRNAKNKGGETTAAVWDYAQGASGYGTVQQSGSVWEWCRDWYDEGYYKAAGADKDPVGPAKGSCRVIRGGSWTYGRPGLFRGAYRRWGGPGSRIDDLGFRLVRAAPKPSGEGGRAV